MSESSTVPAPPPFDVNDWDMYLSPLAKRFQQKEENPWWKGSKDVFTDAYGNSIIISQDNAVWDVMGLVTAGKDGCLEIEETDKGHLYYTLQKHTSGHWVFSETKLDLDGDIGAFTDYVIVEDLSVLKDWLKKLGAEE